MRTWLYDPQNDYQGRIFDNQGEIDLARENGWVDAPYPDPGNLVKNGRELTPFPPKNANLVEISEKQGDLAEKLPGKEVSPKKPFGRKPRVKK